MQSVLLPLVLEPLSMEPEDEPPMLPDPVLPDPMLPESMPLVPEPLVPVPLLELSAANATGTAAILPTINSENRVLRTMSISSRVKRKASSLRKLHSTQWKSLGVYAIS